MADYCDILISLHPKYTDAMLAGSKTVELRRRPIRIARGGRVWIYTTSPRAIVEAVGIVDRVIIARPGQIWSQCGAAAAIPKKDFDIYFSDVQNGCAIVFQTIYGLSNGASLANLRKKFRAFHPPQFFKSLSPNSAELRYLEDLHDVPRQRAA